MLDWVDETPTGLGQVSAFSEDGNRAARIRVESFTPDVHKGVILEAMTVHEATGLTPSQLQARVAELEAKLTSLMASAFDLNFIAANDDGLDVNGKTASAISKHYHKARNS